MRIRPSGYNAVAHFKLVTGADGLTYIHDPQFQYWWIPHVHIPQAAPADAGGGGLGMAPQTHAGLQTADMALNFIPGIGPILSSIGAAALSIFGGGDPTPRTAIWSALITLRQQVADLRNAIAAASGSPPVDSFSFSGDVGADREGGDMAAAIANEVLQLHPGEAEGLTLSHEIQRTDEYNAIKALQGIHDQLQGDLAHVQQQAAAIAPAQTTGVPAPPATASGGGVAPVPVSTGATPFNLSSGAAPLVLLAIAAGAFIVMRSGAEK